MPPSLAELQAATNPRMTFPGLRTDMVTPYPYQVVDAAYLCLNPRTLVAEYTGAGKKLIVILAFLKLASLMRAKRMLILSIPDDIDQWIEEIDAFTEGFTTEPYRGTPAQRKAMRDQTNPADIWISTYKTALTDLRHILGLFDVIVPDEASILRNPETTLQPAIAALCAPTHREMALYFLAKHRVDMKNGKISPNAQFIPPTYHGDAANFVWPLTATPYETGPMNVWSGYNVMLGQGSPLGRNPNAFKNHFCVVERPKMKVKSKKGSFTIRIEKIVGVKPERMDDLGLIIKPYYVRHPWDVVAKHLPKVKVIPHWLELTKNQRKLYSSLADDDRLLMEFQRKDGLTGITAKEVTAAVRFHYQTRVCDGLYALPGQGSRVDSSKMQWVIGMLKGELAFEKVVVFSLRYSNLDFIEHKLHQDHIETLRIDGHPDRTDEMNTQARHSFMDPAGPRVLLVTMKAMRALNLQIANHMICYNVMSNPKANEQLFGRIARRKANGSTEPVIVHMPLCRKTVEETIIWPYNRNREQESTELFGSKFDESPYSNLTPSELERLVRA